ncbi:MAG: aspartate/glutamate racemase family protein, partial [Terriglobia bacterium]
TASQSACGDDIQSQKSPAAMMMTHSPRPACVQISTFLRDCRQGEIRPNSRRLFLDVIERLRDQGAEGIVLGCTEIPLLVQPQHCDLPLFNTALLHAGKALDFALQPVQ